MEENNFNNDKNYISLFEASKLCSYSEPYLRLRARQGKLKSIKLGKRWMTTAAWLDDYGARVQEWREMTEAKKNNLPAATLVAAPLELSNNLGQDDLSKNETPPVSEVAAVFADVVEDEPVAASFCAGDAPAIPSKRLAAFPPAGQLFPVPKQAEVENVSSLGWFGALLSGAVCALALFAAINYGDIPRMIDTGQVRIGQANARQAVYQINGNDQSAVTPSLEDIYFQFPQNISLKDLVDSIAHFFGQ